MTTTTVEYATKINSTHAEIKSINALNYQSVCEDLNCYEKIKDDIPVKLYFDIDYYNPEHEYCEGLSTDLIRISKNIISKFSIELLQIEPEFAVCTSNSGSFVDWKSGKEKWKISIHIVVNNVIAFKSVQNNLIKQFNKFAKETTDYQDYIGEQNLFDESIYDKNRKLRSVGCSKPNENRPVILVEGTFENSVITAFIPDNAVEYQEEPQTSPEPKNTIESPFKETNKDYDLFVAFIESGLLKENVAEHNHLLWCKTAFAFINVLGVERARVLFGKLTMECGSDSKKMEWEDHFDKYLSKESNKDAKKVGRKFIIDSAKKQDPEMVKSLMKPKKSKPDLSGLIICQNDNEASDVIFDLLKDVVKYSNKQLYYKENNVWINDDEKINDMITKLILSTKIYKLDTKDQPITYVQDMKHTKNVKDAFLLKIRTNNDEKFNLVDKFHTTTKGRLCFIDGVLDFIQKKFYLWDEIDFEYYSCIQIPLSFKTYFDTPDNDIINKIKEDIFTPLFGEKVDIALHFFSRAMCGHIEDKNFGTFLGNRDCGKGVLYSLFEGMGDYVKPLTLDNLLISRSDNKSQEASRMLYWLLDYEFCRLAFAQETPDPTKKLKINGSLFKKICSGGDTQTARRNYDRKDTNFKIDMTPFIAGNDTLEFSCEDVKEHQVEFIGLIQFKSAEKIEEMKKEGIDDIVLKSYRVADPTIKDLCKTEAYHLAFIMLLFQSYKTKAVVIKTDVNDESAFLSIRQQLLTTYEFTHSKSDMILCADVLPECDKKKIIAELQSMGVVKTKCNKAGEMRNKYVFTGLKLKVEEDIDGI